MKLVTYLIFEGNAMEALQYYQSILGGEITNVQKYGEMPDFDSMPEFQDYKDYLIHGRLETEEFDIYFSDSQSKVNFGNSVSLSLQLETEAEINRIYEAMTADAIAIEMELGDAFWGAKYGSFIDKFNIHWQLNYQIDQGNV